MGIGCRFPGAEGPEAFWELLRLGRTAIREVPEGRWPDTPRPDLATQRGGFIDGVDRFDAELFGIAHREATLMDPQQRLCLEVSWAALEHAGQAPDRLRGSRAGVFLGISHQDYARLLWHSSEGHTAYAGTGTSLAVAANRISYLLDLRGPSLAIDTACLLLAGGRSSGLREPASG